MIPGVTTEPDNMKIPETFTAFDAYTAIHLWECVDNVTSNRTSGHNCQEHWVDYRFRIGNHRLREEVLSWVPKVQAVRTAFTPAEKADIREFDVRFVPAFIASLGFRKSGDEPWQVDVDGPVDYMKEMVGYEFEFEDWLNAADRAHEMLTGNSLSDDAGFNVMEIHEFWDVDDRDRLSPKQFAKVWASRHDSPSIAP